MDTCSRQAKAVVRWNSHQASGKGQRLWIFSQLLRGILHQIQKCNSFSYAAIRNDLLDNEFLKFSWRKGKDAFKKPKLYEGLFAALWYRFYSRVAFGLWAVTACIKILVWSQNFHFCSIFHPWLFFLFFSLNIGQWNPALFVFKSRSFQKKKEREKVNN